MSKQKPRKERSLSHAREIPDPPFEVWRLEALERRALLRAAERERFARSVGAVATIQAGEEKVNDDA